MSIEKTPVMNELREISEQISKRVSLSFVEKYVDIPALAEERLALLYIYLREEGVDAERSKILCITTGLVQLGMDTHETVKTSYDATLSAERTRQLTVLAGDFFSGYYYQLLADAGEVEAIRVLAEAIEQVNEAKMKLYMLERENKLSFDLYLPLRKTIDTAPFVAFVKFFSKQDESRRFWISLFEESSAAERMIEEWEQLKWQQQNPIGFSQVLLQKQGFSLANVLSGIEAKAMELLSGCEQLVKSFQPIENQNPLTWIMSRYSNRVSRLKRVVEEL
ncbi:heptaprenyl diphosphate synthase component 1 [Brevibacillus fulvus]|uniref:Heptaprenyl diphosphate synthase n=1 Tax=Brevibacillus fulvus TaxID=1125967 RepID=A0A939BQN2_9BACL|nr:heptaprenyl diphosphate synthase component 1 [Brevibacillus fulvus]MBM7588707.1 heptaprenyl diphosphate synthase [Brevibacillus fulvus]